MGWSKLFSSLVTDGVTVFALEVVEDVLVFVNGGVSLTGRVCEELGVDAIRARQVLLNRSEVWPVLKRIAETAASIVQQEGQRRG